MFHVPVRLDYVIGPFAQHTFSDMRTQCRRLGMLRFSLTLSTFAMPNLVGLPCREMPQCCSGRTMSLKWSRSESSLRDLYSPVWVMGVVAGGRV